MAKPFTIELVGVQKAIDSIEKYEKRKVSALDKIIENNTLIMAGRSRQLAPIVDGALRKSIYSGEVGKLEYEIGASVFYAPYVEFGTKGYVSVPAELAKYAEQFRNRKHKGDWGDFILAIAEWVRKKGITATQIGYTKSGKVKKAGRRAQDDAAINLAYKIAYIIMKKGIRPQPFLYPAFIEGKKKLVTEIVNELEKPR